MDGDTLKQSHVLIFNYGCDHVLRLFFSFCGVLSSFNIFSEFSNPGFLCTGEVSDGGL